MKLADASRGAVVRRTDESGDAELLAQIGLSADDAGVFARSGELLGEGATRSGRSAKTRGATRVSIAAGESIAFVLEPKRALTDTTTAVLELFATLAAPAIEASLVAPVEPRPTVPHTRPEPVADSVVMQQIAATLKQLGPTNVPVLLLGERGVGKRYLAYYMHRSAKNGTPLCEIDCLRPASDVEREIQHFESLYPAGTLLLHRVDELSSSAQARLARMLRNGHSEGQSKSTTVHGHWRIVCTSEVPLHDLVTERRMRDDLMSVVATVTLTIPPLRERPEDVVALATSFLRSARQSPQASFSSSVLRQLRRHSWPGNVLELKRLVEYLAIFGDGDSVSQIPPLFMPSSASGGVGGSLLVPFGMSLKEIEEKLISATLDRTGNKKSRTAEILKVDRVTLYRRLKRTIPGTTIL
ncbi:MAG: sigma-54-dependent Fis family transcriptional regulator [Myxococcales bacterium]|nr:sigma-54-dependent Fis family transcriptional regulator [Myxococcales bacterium]